MNLRDLIELYRRGVATISVEEYGAVANVARGTAYLAVRRGDVQAIRVSSRWRVLVGPLLSQLGVSDVWSDRVALPENGESEPRQ